jgi:ADP-heptose:LPS heptosyltransferase
MEVLFITYNRLGDAVLSTGLLNHLAKARQDVRITLACGPVPAPLFAAMPGLVELIVLEKGPRLTHWRKLWRKTVGRRWDLVVDLRGSALAWLLRADKRVVAGKAADDCHRVQSLARLFDLEEVPFPALWNTDSDNEFAKNLMTDEGSNGKVLAIGPTANWGGKQWPLERFVELAVKLTGAGGILANAQIAVFGAPQEKSTTDAVLAALPAERRIDANAGQQLPATYACLRRCDFFIGNDSGLMHMAAAAGIPTLGLFGPSREEHYGPWGPQSGHVRTDNSYEEITNHPDYDFRRDDSWMLDLSLEKAEYAARQLFARLAAASD